MAALLGCLLLFTGVPAIATTISRDTAGLLALKASMGDPPSLASWHGEDPCGDMWDGVTCKSFGTTPSVVIEVHLNERVPKLDGQLPGPGSPFWSLRDLAVFDIMWNAVGGGLPEDVGNLVGLQLLLLSGNQLSGPLPRSLGKLQQINRIQIDENLFTGPVPSELGGLPLFKHLHFNNNSLSGGIPPSLGKLPKLVHLLLDNNNLSGVLPPEIANISTLTVMQLDNNAGISGSIPIAYGKMPRLRKMSMRNCALSGTLPDLSGLPELFFLDLSGNQLTGQLPSPLGSQTSTISLGGNSFSGAIPKSYSNLTNLQVLFCESCGLNGTIPEGFGSVGYLASGNKSIINLQRNRIDGNIPFGLVNGVRRNSLSLYLKGNDICESEMTLLGPCDSDAAGLGTTAAESPYHPEEEMAACECNDHLSPMPVPAALMVQRCVCAGPVLIGMRLKSPSFSVFQPYVDSMREFLAQTIKVNVDQVAIGKYNWEAGPRLNFTVLVFPAFSSDEASNALGPLAKSESERIFQTLYNWDIPDRDVLGPFEQRFFVQPLYSAEEVGGKRSSFAAGVIVAIVLGCMVAGVVLGTVTVLIVYKVTGRRIPIGGSTSFYATQKGAMQWTEKMPKVRGCQLFSHEELRIACDGFSDDKCVGKGGYGRVFMGTLPNGDEIAVKVPDRKSWQGKDEFDTEIELLSRVHHRNLVNLVGFCCEPGTEALVYEYIPGGTLKQHLEGKGSEHPLPFLRRVIIALESAQAVNYLHTAASPPIIHRDLKTGNILLDAQLHAKVADFGLSKKALDPYDDRVSLPTSLREPPVPGSPLSHHTDEDRTPAPYSGQSEHEYEKNISTRNPDDSTIKGTLGYVDPDYFASRELTAKSDVYSFGVVLAEMATGKTPMHAMQLLLEYFEKENTALEPVVDPNMGPYPTDAMLAFLQLARRSVHPESNSRPSMADVIRSLEAILQHLPQENWETRAHSALRQSVASHSGNSASFQSSGGLSSSVAASYLSFPLRTPTPTTPSKTDDQSEAFMTDYPSTSFEVSGNRGFTRAGVMSFREMGPR